MQCLYYQYQSLPSIIQEGSVFKTDLKDLKNPKQPPSEQHSEVPK